MSQNSTRSSTNHARHVCHKTDDESSETNFTQHDMGINFLIFAITKHNYPRVKWVNHIHIWLLLLLTMQVQSKVSVTIDNVFFTRGCKQPINLHGCDVTRFIDEHTLNISSRRHGNMGLLKYSKKTYSNKTVLCSSKSAAVFLLNGLASL